MPANHHPTPARALPVAPLAALVIAASVCASPAAQSYSRDSDGSRLQARFHRLGTSASDSLKPPADAADWRSVKLKRGQTLSVRVSHQPHNAPVAVSLHNSQGRQLAATTSRGGQASLSHRATPGFYYIAVSSRKAVSYTITIR